MSNIVSLSKARKTKARAKDEAKAQANRALFGRTKAEKRNDIAAQTLAERRLQAHRIDPKRDKADD